MPNQYLLDLIADRHEAIFRELTKRLAALPRSRYQTFMKTAEGEQRIRQWLANLIEALRGNKKVFFNDTREIGNLRADQGFRVDFIFRYYINFQNIILELLKERAEKEPAKAVQMLGEFYELANILTPGLQVVTTSYLKKREDIISEKVEQLELISDFTRKIISSFSIDKIATYIQKEILELFGARDSVLALYHPDNNQRIFTCPEDELNPDVIMPILKATRKAGTSLFMASTGKITRNVRYSDTKRVVSVPIQANNRQHGVLLISNWKDGFHFTEKEHSFLLQFINIIVVALDNALMLEEIENSRKNMQLLVGNIINIEEERKERVAGNIHDTLTQTLTAIGYKIQLCKELCRTDPDSMERQLEILLESVHNAISQARHITSSLHPDLIVNLGLIPALERHITSFEKETGIRVKTTFTCDMQIPYDIKICLFRVVQEALTNILKHADSDHAEIILCNEENGIRLTVKDNGRGIRKSDLIPELRSGTKMGLMILKNRVESVGGTLQIRTGKGRGGCIEVVINTSKEHMKDEQNQSDDR